MRETKVTDHTPLKWIIRLSSCELQRFTFSDDNDISNAILSFDIGPFPYIDMLKGAMVYLYYYITSAQVSITATWDPKDIVKST